MPNPTYVRKTTLMMMMVMMMMIVNGKQADEVFRIYLFIYLFILRLFMYNEISRRKYILSMLYFKQIFSIHLE
jgi:hypothetical protein